MCPNGTQIKYKIGQKIKIKSNHPLFGGSSGIIKQIPNHTEVIVELDNGQTESIGNEYIQLELDSSIQELPKELDRFPGEQIFLVKPKPNFQQCIQSYALEYAIYQERTIHLYQRTLNPDIWQHIFARRASRKKLRNLPASTFALLAYSQNQYLIVRGVFCCLVLV